MLKYFIFVALHGSLLYRLVSFPVKLSSPLPLTCQLTCLVLSERSRSSTVLIKKCVPGSIKKYMLLQAGIGNGRLDGRLEYQILYSKRSQYGRWCFEYCWKHWQVETVENIWHLKKIRKLIKTNQSDYIYKANEMVTLLLHFCSTRNFIHLHCWRNIPNTVTFWPAALLCWMSIVKRNSVWIMWTEAGLYEMRRGGVQLASSRGRGEYRRANNTCALSVSACKSFHAMLNYW